MFWGDVVGALPGGIRGLLSSSEITCPDQEGKRIIYTDNPGALILNYRLGALLTIVRLIQKIMDPKDKEAKETQEIEISLAPKEEGGPAKAVEVWDTLFSVFPGTVFLGYERKEKGNHGGKDTL